MNLPTPAIVAERGAKTLPRPLLLLFCAAYVLPGLFGRDPWRNADLTAYGFMAAVAEGRAPWWQPAIAGIPADGGPLPYWIGALAIKALPFLDPAFAARLPYGVMLALVLVLAWYSSFHLARTDAAQPVAFAFGGEAHSVDYARALADGALLALMASLGLLQLGHETTPELLQLLAMSLYLYGLAAAPFRHRKSRWALLVALPMLAASGAPAVALVLALLGAWLCMRSSYAEVRAMTWWLLGAGLLALLSAWEFNAWARRIALPDQPADFSRMLGLMAWFCWPAWPLALWTIWRWRAHWQRRHILVPLVTALVPLVTCILMNGVDRALLLALPALAVLAAFALPTFKRSFAAAIDWFSVFYFSAAALFFWIYYLSMHLGWPAQPLANMRKLAPGFEPAFGLVALIVGVVGTLAWMALVRWRTARHQHALWKSLVLPAGGVALCWLLAMSLLMPPLDYARSNTVLVARLRALLPAELGCLAVQGQALSMLASLEVQGRWKIEPDKPLATSACTYALQSAHAPVPAGWEPVAGLARSTDRTFSLSVLRRQP